MENNSSPYLTFHQTSCYRPVKQGAYFEEDEMDIIRNKNRRNIFKILVGKPQGKRLLGRPTQMKGNTKIDIIENCELDTINIYSVLCVVLLT